MCGRVQNFLFGFLMPPVLQMWMVPQAHSLVLIHFPEVLGAVHLYN